MAKILKERLRRLRINNDLTQEEFAKVLGYGKTTISNYECGYSEPDNDNLIIIANKFAVSVDWLLGRVDDPHVFLPPNTPDLPPEAQKQLNEYIELLKLKYK